MRPVMSPVRMHIKRVEILLLTALSHLIHSPKYALIDINDVIPLFTRRITSGFWHNSQNPLYTYVQL
jgi:hypothetical protein